MLPLVLVPAVGVGIAGGWLIADAARFAAGGGYVSQGGTPHGTFTGKLMGYRNVLGFGLQHATNPARLRTMWKAEADARKGEHLLFRSGGKNGYDNGPDAYRHAYGSALIVYRLVRDNRMSVDRATLLARKAAMTHERDSFLTGPHRIGSRDMDIHNNELGFRVAAAMLAREGVRAGGEARLSNAILDSIRGGHARVLDHIDGPLRSSRVSDVDGPRPIPDAAGWSIARARKRQWR